MKGHPNNGRRDRRLSLGLMLLALAGVCAVLWPTRSMAASTRTVSVQPATTSVQPSGTFTIAVAVDDSTGIAGCQFDLVYDGSLMTFSPPPGPGTATTGQGWVFAYNQVDANTLRVIGYTNPPAGLPSGSGGLVNLNFTAGSGTGKTSVALQSVKLSDASGVSIAATGVNGTVVVSQPLVANAGPDQTIASGGSCTLQGSASGGISPYTYSWSPTTGLSDATSAQPTASPTATTTYTLTVTDSAGQQATASTTVTVAPPVVADAGADQTIAAGGSCTLQGSASGGVSPYTYSWSPTTGLSDATSAQPKASPTATTTYTLTVTDSLGQKATDSVTVTVATPVVANAGSSQTINAGASCTLQGSASGGVAPYTYSWSPSTGLSDASSAQPTASPTVTTTYTLTVTDSLGQQATASVTVTVIQPLAANAGPDQTIASGGSCTLQGSASGGVSPYTYAWSPTSGLSDATSAQPTASPAATTTYTLTVTDSLGKKATDTVTVTVASAVVADAGPDQTIASGGSCTLQGSASGGVSPYTYAWSPTTGLSAANVAQPKASPTATTTYTLTVTDSLGQKATDSVTVTVASAVVATAGADQTIASGGSCTLQGSASGGVSPYTYSWSPSTGLSDASVAQPKASPTATTTYTLTVTDSLGQKATDSVTVTVASAVVANAGPDQTIASGGSCTLQGSASGGVSPYTYAWSPTTGLSAANVAQPKASPTATTTYTLTVTDNLGQKATDSATVTVVSPPVTDFSGTPTSGTAPLAVKFTDQSTNAPTSWAWDFGDNGKSTVQNPSHTYATAGAFTVSLTATNAGGSDTKAKANYITVTPAAPPVADFSGTPTSGAAPLGVQFTDASTNAPTSWSWDFGDGQTATVQNPAHQYIAGGSFSVSLTATNAAGSDTKTKADYITVTAPAGSPVADFSATPLSGTEPLPVQFTDASTGSPTAWAWDFGDGKTSTEQNPSHQYEKPGHFNVILTASNASGSSTLMRPDYIVVSPLPPTADFSATPLTGTAPLTVQFTDASTGDPTHWVWSFGDGKTSTDQNPSHTYTSGGTFTVSLTAVDMGGATTKRKQDYITVSVPASAPTADFTVTPSSGNSPLDVQFTDTSTGSPTTWAWDFGDGETSAAQSPSHTYQQTGPYTVALTASNTAGADTKVEPYAVWVTFSDVPSDQWAGASISACVADGIVAGYPGGSYQPDAPVARDQMAVYIARALAGGDEWVPSGPATPTFPDVPANYWAYKYIEYVYSRHVVAGYAMPDGTYDYAPANSVDRAQMAVYISRAIADPTGDAGLASYVPPTTPSFSDVDTSYWAYMYIEYAHAQGIVNGYPDGTYGPENMVTRDQMAVYVARAFKLPTT